MSEIDVYRHIDTLHTSFPSKVVHDLAATIEKAASANRLLQALIPFIAA